MYLGFFANHFSHTRESMTDKASYSIGYDVKKKREQSFAFAVPSRNIRPVRKIADRCYCEPRTHRFLFLTQILFCARLIEPDRMGQPVLLLSFMEPSITRGANEQVNSIDSNSNVSLLAHSSTFQSSVASKTRGQLLLADSFHRTIEAWN